MNTFRIKLILVIIYLIAPLFSEGQLSKNWFNEDPDKDRFAGVSSDNAYENLLKDMKSVPIVVAVIDGGTDVNHPDLKSKIWVNPKEVAGNGIDDDKNGYIDDIHGWSFIGGPKDDIKGENLEMVRIFRKLDPVFKGKTKKQISKNELNDFKLYDEIKVKMEVALKDANSGLKVYSSLKKQMDDLKQAIGKDTFTEADVLAIESEDEEFNNTKNGIAEALKNGVSYDIMYQEVMAGYNQFYSQVNYHLNPEFSPRAIVGDNEANQNEKYYGNNNVIGPEADHGTHVAGIIGAVRNNEIGMNGVADNVHLMILRVVPDGDERDKDVANAIRYAVDNGAKVINMSFGKDYSPNKNIVDEAIRYAEIKDVLLIHGAGNDASNVDSKPNYPGPYGSDKNDKVSNWIEVGAISSSGDAARFSNYGKERVDVFAPGVQIYATTPDASYDFHDGTSMASPVVAGIAAMVWSYFPELNARQVKLIITSSVIKVPFKTQLPGSRKKVKFTSLCNTGGIVNAYRAISVAKLVSVQTKQSD
ncbi:MAG: S8 family peptidase [Bacteroidetes bacterium]|nr:S8 family peptidase [Bacteroidota bacterium]